MTLVLKCFDRSEPHPSGLSSRRASRGWGKAGNRPGRGELQRGWSGAERSWPRCGAAGGAAQHRAKKCFFFFFLITFSGKIKRHHGSCWLLVENRQCCVGWDGIGGDGMGEPNILRDGRENEVPHTSLSAMVTL